MSSYSQRIVTVLRSPTIGGEYCRWIFQKHVVGKDPVRQLHGIEISGFNGFSEYHTVSQGISSDEEAFLSGLALSSGAIIDVGANLGLFSLTLSRRFPDRQLFAIEPGPTTFPALVKNIARNKARNVACYECAVANWDGEVSFATRENARANASITSKGSSDENTASVPCFTLDSFCRCNDIGKIALLKVDVEGFETLVFKGAGHVLKFMRPPTIYFEVCPALTRLAGFDPAEPADILIRCGYELNRIGRDGMLEPVKSTQASQVERVENWVASLPSYVKRCSHSD